MSPGFAIVGPIGPLELGVILLILIVIFGPKRLPGIGRSLGEGMREFKDSVTGGNKSEADKPELPAAREPAPEADEPRVAAVDAEGAARERDPSGRSA